MTGKMASFGMAFCRCGRFSLLMKVLAFLTSKNEKKHVLKCKYQLLETAIPRKDVDCSVGIARVVCFGISFCKVRPLKCSAPEWS